MTSAYTVKLGLTLWTTIVGTQKIDGSTLKTYGIVTAKFLVYDKLSKAWFFEETFLLANTSIEVFLKMSFLFLSKANL